MAKIKLLLYPKNEGGHRKQRISHKMNIRHAGHPIEKI